MPPPDWGDRPLPPQPAATPEYFTNKCVTGFRSCMVCLSLGGVWEGVRTHAPRPRHLPLRRYTSSTTYALQGLLTIAVGVGCEFFSYIQWEARCDAHLHVFIMVVGLIWMITGIEDVLSQEEDETSLVENPLWLMMAVVMVAVSLGWLVFGNIAVFLHAKVCVQTAPALYLFCKYASDALPRHLLMHPPTAGTM